MCSRSSNRPAMFYPGLTSFREHTTFHSVSVVGVIVVYYSSTLKLLSWIVNHQLLPESSKFPPPHPLQFSFHVEITMSTSGGRKDDVEEGSASASDLRKPFLHTGSWYKMGSRQSSLIGSSTYVLRDGSISVLLCVLIAALGPIQFGFSVSMLHLFKKEGGLMLLIQWLQVDFFESLLCCLSSMLI